jgi:uncharacterized membrane protein
MIAVSSLDNEILASEGSTVTLKCPYGLTWEYSIFSEKLIFSKIADRNLIDPTLRKSVRYHIKSDVEAGNYDLQISNVTSDDDGVYRCTYVKENKAGQNDILLRLKSTYLRFYLFVCRDISQYLIKLVGWFYCV